MIKLKKILLLLPLLFSCEKKYNNDFIDIKINELIFIDYNNFSYKIIELGILTVEKGFVINDIYIDLETKQEIITPVKSSMNIYYNFEINN